MADVKLCSVVGCNARHKRRSLCSTHLSQYIRKGIPLPPPANRKSITKFGEPLKWFKEVVINYDGEDCLVWKYGRTGWYGTLYYNGKNHAVHRLVCEVRRGPAPSSKHVARHLCGGGKIGCCNPNHIAWGTAADNSADARMHGTLIRGETQGLSKLTEYQVKEIRSDKRSGEEISIEYGVNRSTINRIKRRETWGWLD
jgi:hypothetical protein